MHQRQLRLGDILDDYCPRERRITNHAIVAMVGQDVKQTRCTTCDTEHEYKQARIPPQRRKKESQTALFDDVLAGMPRRVITPARADTSEPQAAGPAEPETEPDSEPVEQPILEPVAAAAPVAPAPVAAVPAAPGPLAASAPDEVEGPVHRQLIRATLPRPEGQATARPIPEFTARTTPPSRPAGRFRPRPGGPPGGAANGFGFRGRRNGNGMAAGGPAPHGNRARPAKAGQGPHRRRGGKKRSK